MAEEERNDLGVPTCVGTPARNMTPGEVMEKLKELTAQAMPIGTSIAGQTQDLNELWDMLLPILHEVEALLSSHCTRCQVSGATGLPTWEQWRAGFLRESGLAVSERTAQRRLKSFQEMIGSEPKKPGNNPGAMSATQRYRLRLALLAANDMAEAMSEGEDPSEALARFSTYTIDSDRLRDALRRL